MLLGARRSAVTSMPLFFAAAVLAAHAAAQRAGFLSSDVRFFLQLFTNLVEWDLSRPGEGLHLTQVGRSLVRLREATVLVAYAKGVSTRGRGGERYVATREGVSVLAEHLAITEPRMFEETVFVAYFLRAYGPSIRARTSGARAREIDRHLDVAT